MRLAFADDRMTIADIWVRSWQVGYAGIVAQAHLDALDPQHRYRQIGRPMPGTDLIVAARGDAVIGFAVIGPWRGDDAGSHLGELWALYVAPEHWGQGAGRLLITEAVRRLGQRGFGEFRLWVLEANLPGRRFYERAGWAPDGARQTYEFDGDSLPEVRYALRAT